jgi:hypothetical protein
MMHPPPNYQAQQGQGFVPQNTGYPGMPPIMPAPQAFPQYAMPQVGSFYTAVVDPLSHKSQPYPAPQPMSPGYQPGSSPVAAYGSPAPSVAHQNWQHGYTSSPYPSRAPPSSSPAQMGPVPMGQSPSQMGSPHLSQSSQMGVPYAYGQLPANVNPHDPKSQHPIPGSYNRNHGFNPQTQSFIPGSNTGPNHQPPQPQPPFTAPGSHHGSPQIASPHLSYPGYHSSPQHPYGGGYGMVRQLSNHSMSGFHPQQHMMPIQAPLGPMAMQVQSQQPHLQAAPPVQYAPARPQAPPQAHGQVYSHLATYGSPASLPQKPTTRL